MIPPAQRIGKYQILAQIGSGGFATVYRATDQILNREVALKVLHPQLLIDNTFVKRFFREARAASSPQLTVGPDKLERASLNVRPGRLHWFGRPVQHNFSVIARPTGQGETHTAVARFVQKALVSSWLIAALVLASLVMLFGLWSLTSPQITMLSTVPGVPVAGDPFAVRWSVMNGPTVEIRVNQTPIPVTPDANSVILSGYQAPPQIELVARNRLFGRDSKTIAVSLIAPSATPTNTPTPLPTLTPPPPPPPTPAL